MPEPFLATLSHSPSEVACRSSRKASHAPREAKGTIGRSGLAVMASPFDDRRYFPPNRRAERALALAASSSRSFGGAAVSSEASNRSEILAMSSTAEWKAASFILDGLLKPVTFLTYCSDAAFISSLVAGGSKLKSVLMFLHIKLCLQVE